jgi:hypothetical protein
MHWWWYYFKTKEESGAHFAEVERIETESRFRAGKGMEKKE